MKTRHALPLAPLSLALVFALGVAQAQDHSQHQMPTAPAATQDHSQHQMPPAPLVKKPALKKAAKKQVKKPASSPKTTDPHAGHRATKPPAQSSPTLKVDHSTMGRDASPQTPPVDYSKMDHGAMSMPADKPMPGMDHATMEHDRAPDAAPITPIPALTQEDRAAAFAPVHPHAMHDNAIHSFVLINRLEAWNADKGTGLQWEGQGWIGTDLNRLWLRSEGEREHGHTEAADLEVLYGRSVARWWDVVAGVRHEFKPGTSQTFAAIGVQGLAPQKFEVEATAYLGESGQTALRFEAERELLLTNRLILQPLIEASAYGKNDARRGIGSGLSTVEAGVRLRYEFRREFAPYIGIAYERAFGNTADFRREEGEDLHDTRIVAGVRIWF